jgi:hypothetical protein
MIIYNLYFTWPGIALFPAKTDAPLIIDPDAPLAFAIAAELFQMVTRKSSNIIQVRSHIQTIQNHFGTPPERLERFHTFAPGEFLRPGTPIAQDHAACLPDITRYVKRNNFM